MTMLTLMFEIEIEPWALDLTSVETLLPAIAIAEPADKLAESLAGFVDFRGARMPVFDLRKILGKGMSGRAFGTRYAVYDIGAENFKFCAVIVERAASVAEISEMEIEPAEGGGAFEFFNRRGCKIPLVRSKWLTDIMCAKI